MTQAKFDRDAIIQAVLAEDVYAEHRHRGYKDGIPKVVVTFPDGSKEEKLEVLRDFPRDGEVSDKDGFQAAIYYNRNTNTIHGAIRGTEFDRELWKDGIVADFVGMGLTGLNSQANSARDFIKELLREAQNKGNDYGYNPKIHLTGHSLGGSIAQYLAHYAGDRIDRTDTFNAFGVGDLRWAQKVPVNEKVDNVYNHRMAGDTVSKLSRHYGQVIVYEHPQKDGIDHAIANFTGNGINDVNVLVHEKYNLAYQGADKVATEIHPTGKSLNILKNVLDAPNATLDFVRSKITGVAKAGERADKDGLPEYKSSPINPLPPEIQTKPEKNKPEKMINQPIQSSQSTEQKEDLSQLSPKAQKLYHQCEEKLIALCQEKGITADSPQDFTNIAAALAAKGVVEHDMKKVDKMDMDMEKLNIFILSYEPHAKWTSVNANEAVHIPAHESFVKIHQTEQQQAQLAQEREMNQNQSQQRGMSLV